MDECSTSSVKQERRAAIAAAARELIAENGFEGLRTRDIAARVGINIATLHYHLPTKEALIKLVATSLRDEFIAKHKSHPRDGLSPTEKIRLELAEFRETLEFNEGLVIVLGELIDRARRDPAIADAVNPMLTFWRGKIADVLLEGRQDGSFRNDLDPDAAASLMIGTIISLRRMPDGLALFDRVAAELERCLKPSASWLG